MEDKDLRVMLKSHGLKYTRLRAALLKVFIDYSFALSQTDLKELTTLDADRVTLYRTLKIFEENGIIHQVIDSESVVKYASCADTCSEHQHYDTHIHFKCNSCEHTYCLNEKNIPIVSLPEGYFSTHSSMLIEGICRSCNCSTT